MPHPAFRRAAVAVAGAVFAMIAGAALLESRDFGLAPHRISVATDSADALAALGRFHAALAGGDSAGALALLAADVTILESGDIESRADYAAHHLMADIEYAKAARSTYSVSKVSVRGDVAWIASTSVSRGEVGGRTVNSVGAELVVLSRTAQGWEIRSIHWSSRRRS